MAYEITSKEEIAKYIRQPISKVEDYWYIWTLGLIEQHTGMFSLSEAQDVTQTIDGDGSYFLPLYKPLNSVTSIVVNGTTLPTVYYDVRRDGVYLKSHYTSNLEYESSIYYIHQFSPGISNIEAVYNAGGITRLSPQYINSLKLTIALCIETLSTPPRSEGSDQVLRNYRPINEEYQRKDETMSERGIHGKLLSIIKTTLPKRVVFR